MSTKAWRDANPEYHKRYQIEYCKNNPEKIRAKQKRYDAANREKRAAFHKAYCKANPEKMRALYAKGFWRRTLGPDAPPELIDAYALWTMVRRELRK
jgi:hypothetical protein